MSFGKKQGFTLTLLISACLILYCTQKFSKETGEKINRLLSVSEKEQIILDYPTNTIRNHFSDIDKEFTETTDAIRLTRFFINENLLNTISEIKSLNQDIKNTISSSKDNNILLSDIENIEELKSKFNILSSQLLEAYSQIQLLENILFVLYVITILLIISISQITYTRGIKKEINKITNTLDKLAKGDISKIETIVPNEFKNIHVTINTIIDNQANLASFAESIGDGNYQVHYNRLGDNDKIGIALLGMCDKLQKVNAEEKRRNWANEGLAKFSEILRNESNEKSLSDKLLVALIKYINANQGTIYLKYEEGEKYFLKLISSYAWDRMKYEDKEIEMGEGLIGQAAMEREYVYLTDIPENFIRITSGLGEALPSSVLIMPLCTNTDILGIMEFAFFRNLEKYEIDFLEKIATSIATTISSVKTNEQTLKLLGESREMTKEMKLQEGELIKQAEELMSKEETLLRSMKELEAVKSSLSDKLEEAKEEMKQQIKEIEIEKLKNEGILEGCVDAVITFDKKGTIEFFNKASEEIFGYGRNEVLGININQLINLYLDENSGDYSAFYIEKNNFKKPISIRTEISVKSKTSGEIPVLITLSKTVIEGKFYFTVFIQSIAVELF
ncbi:MAG: GAF domain-containing protein [Sporocytophaga sp.]|uniref:GAF domain-containing protein n=1 Tax=Sporocytophaga sp. TaxID=2231183 RepID=UPI001AFE3B4F|nr:GAF domain-containing protein [Sporocytophaga sp.]MBO9703156.1 GAF domain-containing protein [Sporocytophaga sp.]